MELCDSLTVYVHARVSLFWLVRPVASFLDWGGDLPEGGAFQTLLCEQGTIPDPTTLHILPRKTFLHSRPGFEGKDYSFLQNVDLQPGVCVGGGRPIPPTPGTGLVYCFRSMTSSKGCGLAWQQTV